MAGSNIKTAVERFASDRDVPGRPEEIQEINWEEPTDSDQWSRAWKAARPHNRQDIMLDVIKQSGECYSFEYAFLNPMRYEGGDVIELDFGSHRVRIEGRLLKPLRRALKCHMVDFIQEGNDSEDEFKPDGECHIEKISIEELKDGKSQKEETR